MSVDQTQQTDVRSVKERLLHYRVANTFVSVCAARSSDTSDPGSASDRHTFVRTAFATANSGAGFCEPSPGSRHRCAKSPARTTNLHFARAILYTRSARVASPVYERTGGFAQSTSKPRPQLCAIPCSRAIVW